MIPPTNLTYHPNWIAFEGLDGTGKTTQAKLLAKRLNAPLARDPGSTKLAEQLRPIIKQQNISRYATFMMVTAAKWDAHHRVYQPALEQGLLVTDRSTYSTLAYQIMQSNFDSPETYDLYTQWMWSATQHTSPSRVVYLQTPDHQPLRRRRTRRDRFDRMSTFERRQIDLNFQTIGDCDPQLQWHTFDARTPKRELSDAIFEVCST